LAESLRSPALQRDIQGIRTPLERLIKHVQSGQRDVVVIFDGLDRLLTPDRFWAVVHQDFRALRQMGVAVLAAAPLSILYGQGRSVSELFDRVHHIPMPPFEPEHHIHLKSVLEHRGGLDLMDADAADIVCYAPGGVLRDLITLARDSGEDAYIKGSDRILPKHSESAIEQMGESYLRGLGPEQFKILRRLSKELSFDVTSSLNIELLVTRRVLEYSATDFRVHPALGPLIPKGERND